MTEKNMQTFWSTHVKTHLPLSTEVYELKICKGPSLPFDMVQPHQIKALLDAETGGMFYKISDTPWIKDNPMRFTAPKPFDCLAIVGAIAFVVVWFYHERQKKVFIKIPVQTFLHEKEISTRKSLTEDRAKEIGELVYL